MRNEFLYKEFKIAFGVDMEPSLSHIWVCLQFILALSSLSTGEKLPDFSSDTHLADISQTLNHTEAMYALRQEHGDKPLRCRLHIGNGYIRLNLHAVRKHVDLTTGRLCNFIGGAHNLAATFTAHVTRCQKNSTVKLDLYIKTTLGTNKIWS